MNKIAVLFSVLLASITMAASVNASTITVDARKVSTGTYNWETQGDFIISYYNETLPWGTGVTMLYNFCDSRRGSDSDWNSENFIVTQASGAYTWQAQLTADIYKRGYFNFNNLEFYFKITYPNGQVAYDSNSGFYTVNFEQLPVEGPSSYHHRINHRWTRGN